MKYIFSKISLVFVILSLALTSGFAQDGSALPSEKEKEEKRLQFNGLGRAILSDAQLGGEILTSDSTTARQLTNGEFLLDVAINGQPNEDTEVQGILRLRNEFGGFFGSGVSVEVRELWARGLIANTVKYRVGDFDHALTPYTFWNPDEEGTINEPEIFTAQKDVIYYEQFFTEGNRRRVQGAKMDFGLVFPKVLDEIDVSGFVARLRGTDFFTVPTRFIGGGRIDIGTQSLQDSLGLKADIGINLAHTWDDLQSGDVTSGIRNMVWSVDFDIAVIDKEKFGLSIMGEAGQSSLAFKEDSLSVLDEGDSFLEAGVKAELKDAKLGVSATFIDIGPDFFSMAAQSKRVDFNRDKEFFNRTGNDRAFRMPTLFDISRDRALYTFQLSDQLMPYDPRYANVMPYGQATPNRRGIIIGLDYGDSESVIEANVTGAFLQEIRGQGTFELKDLRRITAAVNVNFHEISDWEKTYTLSLGLQNEQATRGGLEVEAIDFGSTLIEIGAQAELFPKFDLLLGAKLLSASGNEYVPIRTNFNDILDFPEQYIADDNETMLGAGLRYRFADDIYLTLQYHQFSFTRATDPSNDYDIRQIFVVYNMEF